MTRTTLVQPRDAHGVPISGYVAHVLVDAGAFSFVVRDAQTEVGRSPEVALCIDHPTVSRRHALLRFSEGQLTIEDLGSANGTWINQVRIEPNKEVHLLPQNLLELGSVAVVLRPTTTAVDEEAPPIRALVAPFVDTDLVDRVARSDISVLILGETGAGKEVMAEHLHRVSTRCSGPMMRINCGGIPQALLESELFGYERGAFTGADARRIGLLEAAHSGTVFLDEIGDMPTTTQVALLRALETRQIMRVGSRVSAPIDVRFISATHHDLATAMAKGTFRQDLYFRLNGVTIEVPALRQRVDEIEPLAVRFATAAAKARGLVAPPPFDPEALRWMREFAWPGNVRQLKSTVERAVLLSDGRVIRTRDLAVDVISGRPRSASGTPQIDTTAGLAVSSPEAVAPTPGERNNDELMREQLLLTLAQAQGNRSATARMLGIARTTLLRRMRRLGIEAPGDDTPEDAAADEPDDAEGGAES